MSRRGFVVVLLLATLLGGGLRWMVMERTHPVALTGDEAYYVQVADRIARRGTHYHTSSRSFAWRPPAHPWLLAQVANTRVPHTLDTADQYLPPLLQLQVLLGALLVLATGLLGRFLFDRRVGCIAAALVAFYPPWIAHSHTLWSEPLFALLVTAGLSLAVLARSQTRPWAALAAGLTFGAATLTRELGLVVAGITALWLVWSQWGADRRRAALHAGLLVGAAVLVVLPWTIRNHRILDTFVPVSSIGWYAAAEGNSLDEQWFAGLGPAGFAFRRQYFAIRSEIGRRDFARDWALERIGAEQPTWLFKKLVRAVAGLGSPETWMLYKVSRGAYGDLPLAQVRFLMLLGGLSVAGLVAAATFGIACAPKPERRLGWWVWAGVLAVHVFANATVRFRLPWIPLLAVFAGLVLAHPQRLRALGRREWLVCSIVVCVVLGLGAAFYAGEAAVVWRAGSAARGR